MRTRAARRQHLHHPGQPAGRVDHHATIGKLHSAAGANAVACHHVPFGRRGRRGRLRDEHPFLVERGSPADGLGGLWLLLPGIAVFLLGLPTASRWRTGSLVSP